MPKVALTRAQKTKSALDRQNIAFARVIDDVRRTRDIRQRQIAMEIGCTPGRISVWKRRSGSMSLQTLRLLIMTQGLTDEQILSILK